MAVNLASYRSFDQRRAGGRPARGPCRLIREQARPAGLARDFEQLRIDFLSRRRTSQPDVAVDQWVASQGARIAQFRQLLNRARAEGAVSAPMLAQIASQARILLAR